MERIPRASSTKSEDSSTPLLGRRKRSWVKAESQREQIAADLFSQSGPDGSFMERWGAELASAQFVSTVTVTYKDLTVTTQAVPGSEAIATIGSLIVRFFKVCAGVQSTHPPPLLVSGERLRFADGGPGDARCHLTSTCRLGAGCLGPVG